MAQRIKTVQESDLRMLGDLARSIQRVLPVTQADIDAAAALGKGWVVTRVFEVSDPLDNLRGGTQLVIRQNSILPGQNVQRVMIVSGPGGQTVVVRGTDYIVLPDAIANSLSYVKAFGGTEQRDIPGNYLQRQYIYMMDGSYIKVEDLLISAGYRVEFEFQTLALSTSLRNYIGGRANGMAAGGGFRLSKLASGGSTLNRVVLYGFENGTEYYDPTAQFQPNTRYKYTYTNGVCTLESGGSVVSTRTFTVTDTTSTKWGINSYVSGNDYWQTDTGEIYVYSVKVWNDQDELVMNLVPAIQQGTVPVVGFYDTVDGTFRTAAAGTLAAGPEAAPTPDAPVDIVSNNGVLKYTPNLLDMATENIVLGKYINNSGVILDSGQNFYNSKYIPVVAGGVYTWSTSSSISYFSVMEYGSDYAFKKRTLFSNAGTSGSITLRSDTAFVLVGSNMDSTDVTLDKIAAVDWQFEKGSSATAYKPYSSTGIYTDGTVETINVHGKNLFDIADADWGYNINASGVRTESQYNSNSNYIKVKPNTQYTCSWVSHSGSDSIVIRFHTYNSSKTWLEQIGTKTYSSDGLQTYTFTTSANTEYVIFTFRGSSSSASDLSTNMQIEQGSTATAYEPYYDGGTATAEMLLKVGDYQDEQEILSGAVTRKVGVKVLTGAADEQWNTSVSTKFYWDTDFAKALNYSPTLCTHYQAILTDRTSGVGNNQIALFVNGAKGRIVICDPRFTTVSDFKAFLADQYAAGTPVIVIYPLATPTTEFVTGQHLQVTAGDNVLEITQASLTGLELEVEYQAAVSLTIQEVEDANLDNNVEVTIS